MSKQYAHLHTMAKTSVKFQNYWPQTVGGVALTRHPLTIRVLGKKTTKLTKRKKVRKKNLRIMSKQYAHLHAMAKTCEVSKRLAKNCRRSCAHKSIVDKRMGHGTPISHLHAKAGVIKMACAPSEDSDQPGHPPSLISLRCALNG